MNKFKDLNELELSNIAGEVTTFFGQESELVGLQKRDA